MLTFKDPRSEVRGYLYVHVCVRCQGYCSSAQDAQVNSPQSSSCVLLLCSQVNRTLPDRILVFRDGVGDGQMSTVAQYEVPQISSCFSMFGECSEEELSVMVCVGDGDVKTPFVYTHTHTHTHTQERTISPSLLWS